MNRALTFLEKLLAAATIFLIPTQLALHFWPTYAFVFGIRVDYLSPTLYLTDILVFGLIILWQINGGWKTTSPFSKQTGYILLIVLFVVLLNIVFSGNPTLSLLKSLKILEMGLFGFYIYSRKSFIGERNIIRTLFVSAATFSLIGITQFFLGRTTGFFYILGERVFNIGTPAIALVLIRGQDFLRSYSTFPHPNALAGFLGATAILLVGTKALKRDWWFYLGTLAISLAFFLTFSLSGFLAVVFVSFIFFSKKRRPFLSTIIKIFFWFSVLSSLFLTLFSRQQFLLQRLNKDVVERLDLSYLAGNMISEKFFFGEGLNTFILNIPKFSRILMTPWLLQPVHNVFLLVFAEAGIAGLLVFVWCVYGLLKNLSKKAEFVYLAVFIFILFTGLTDHYWLTIQQNLLFLSLFIGFSQKDIGHSYNEW